MQATNNKPTNNHPPKWADKLLQWYCRPDLLEEIQGDAYELFDRKVKENKRAADLLFVWNVLRFFRLKNIKNANSSINPSLSFIMLKSYLTSGIRNISKNITHSTINMAGLAIAISCCISIFLLVDSFYNLDRFHKKSDRVYLLVSKVKVGEETESWARTPYLLGPSLIAENPSIESMVRIQKLSDVSVRHNYDVFQETIWSADSSFFDVFSYPILNGSTRPLTNKKAIVISPEKALQYFGTEDPIGKELSVKLSDQEPVLFTVSAVVDNMPGKSSMSFSFIIPMDYWEESKGKNKINWEYWARSTFILLKENHSPSEFASTIKSYRTLQNEANQSFQMRDINWIPIKDVARNSYAIVDCLSWDLHPATIIVISAIVLFLLLLACFNYMNVAIASVSLRLKEIGIRKVIGGSKKQVIIQYMVENFVLCALSLLIGAMLASLFMVPAFNSLYPIHIAFEFSSATTMILFFAGTLILIATLSGAYPSFYVSSFNAIHILKGNQKFGNKSLFSKVMLGFQFTISFTTIIFSLLSVSNQKFFEKKDWGYDRKDVLYVPIHGEKQYLALRDLVALQKSVISYAGSESHIGDDDELTTIQANDMEIQVARFPVGFDYLETLNIRLKEGRFFNSSNQSDFNNAIVVNEALVNKMGWENPIGQLITFYEKKFYVIGVANNFYFADFDKILEPAVIHIAPEEDFKFFVIKSAPGETEELSTQIKKSWSQIAPDDAYLGGSQEEVFRDFYKGKQSDSKIMYFISIVALVLACMGLFGLVSFNISRRAKEFSLRKIFGAELPNIFRLMGQEYLITLLIACLVGSSLGYYLMAQLHYAVYPEPIPLKEWPLEITLVVMTLSVGLTIVSQLHRIIRENPVITLRNE